MHPSSFVAWCRKHGAHETKKYPWHDWNEDLLKPIREFFEKAWCELDAEFDRCKQNFLQSLLKLLDGIREDLRGKELLFTIRLTVTLTRTSGRCGWRRGPADDTIPRVFVREEKASASTI